MAGLLRIGAAGAAAVIVCAVAACGGSTFTATDAGSDGHGGSGSSSGGASSSGGGTPCGLYAPQVNQPCMPNSAACEYGSSPSPACNQIIECLNDTWTNAPMPGCASGTCPAHYADVPQGQGCNEGLDCAYPEGQCNCSITSLGGTGNNPTWHCFQPVGCPEPRPLLGKACSQDGLMCDYGSCTGGLAETCMDGYWHWTMTPCPG